MALRADAVAAHRIEPSRIHDRTAVAGDMPLCRPVAALAGDAPFQKRRKSQTIFRLRQRLKAAGMALQAANADGARKIQAAVARR